MFVLILLFSCEYQVRQFQTKLSSGKIDPSIDVDADFDWKMTHEVVVLVKNAGNRLIKITSADQSVVYHKGFSNQEKYSVTLSIPKRITQVLINNYPVDIQEKAVIFTFPSFKNSDENLNALCFSGGNNFGSATNIVTSYPFTMCVWFKPLENPNPADDMAVCGIALSTNANRIFGIYLSYTAQPDVLPGTISLLAKNGTTEYKLQSTTVAQPGQWYHVAVVYTSKSNRRIYVNGLLQGSDTRSVNLPNMNTLGFARWPDKTPSAYFVGSVDEVKIWKAALSEAQIQADMNAVLTGGETNLYGYWPMEEGSGLITDDLSQYQNIATLSQGIEWCQSYTAWDTDGDGIANDDDDYPDDPLRAFNNSWPASTGTLAFEDLWPSIADYDFNDLVMDYLFNTVTNSENEVVEVFANFTVKATGAGLNNGFGFSLPGILIPSENIVVSGMQTGNGIINLEPNGLEAGQDDVVFIVYDEIPKVGNTRPDAPYNPPSEIVLAIEFSGGTPYYISDLGLESFDPFLFVNQVRSHEIHLANFPPTNLMNLELFGTLDDATNPPGIYFKSIDNLPWALNFPEPFDYPVEKISIWSGHLKFIEWINSGGLVYGDWYTNQEGYRDDEKIYDVQP